MYLRPETIEETVAALRQHGGRVLAGGTDFFPALGEQPMREPVIDISCVAELRGIALERNVVRIGASTTWTDMLRHPLPRCFDALKAAAREVGSVQIQNAGTVAGNLCNASPAADGVPPLLILDAEVELASAEERRRMPLADFISGNRRTLLAPDEIVTEIRIPRGLDDCASAFLKLGARRYLVISIAMVAALVGIDADGRVAQARVAVGACSAVARRLHGLEADLVGVNAVAIRAAVRAEHLAPLSPIDDIRATAEYRRDAALTLVRRALEACVAAG
jgi:CO/xanthine dehydrogenase FAD-binding subunit